MSKAELFDTGQWAELFKESGAKYIVLKGIRLASKLSTELFGTDKPVTVKETGETLIITALLLTPDDHRPAYVFKVSRLIK